MRIINFRTASYQDVKLVIGGPRGNATYYLRVFVDGTFDIYGRPSPRFFTGPPIALGAVGMDGIFAGTALGSRLARFIEDHKGECL